jgi:hypothetical protein
MIGPPVGRLGVFLGWQGSRKAQNDREEKEAKVGQGELRAHGSSCEGLKAPQWFGVKRE